MARTTRALEQKWPLLYWIKHLKFIYKSRNFIMHKHFLPNKRFWVFWIKKSQFYIWKSVHICCFSTGAFLTLTDVCSLLYSHWHTFQIHISKQEQNTSNFFVILKPTVFLHSILQFQFFFSAFPFNYQSFYELNNM